MKKRKYSKLIAVLLSVALLLPTVAVGGFAAGYETDSGSAENDPVMAMPQAGENQQVVFQEIKGQAALDASVDAHYPLLFLATFNDKAKLLYHIKSANTTNQVDPASQNDAKHQITPHSTDTMPATTQQWMLVPVSGGYLIKSTDDNKYLGVDATTVSNRPQLAVGDTRYIYHVEPAEGDAYGYYVYAKDGDTVKYLCINTSNWGWILSTEKTSLHIYAPTVENTEKVLAQKVFKGTSKNQPMDPAQVNSKFFRIPALTTLDNGWLVAASDVRWQSAADSPGNLDTVVSISKDGGKNWEWEVVNYYSDYANTLTEANSSSFIDPALVVDKNGSIWMAVDSLGAGGGNGTGNIQGKESTGFDAQNRLIIAPGTPGERASTKVADYTYYLDLNKEGITAQPTGGEPIVNAWDEPVAVYPIAHDVDGQSVDTDVYADAFFNTYQLKDGKIVPILCEQMGGNGAYTQNNLYYLQSEWRTYPTFLIMIRKGEVTADGIEWGDPIYPNFKNNTRESFTGVCPGRGFAVTLPTGEERLIFMMYDNDVGPLRASALYSDDGGVTWHRGHDADNVGYTSATSESQIIQLPDGRLRLYSRNPGEYISYADSEDYGVTWGEFKPDLSLFYCADCMVSFINVKGVLVGPDGKRHTDVVLASYPSSKAAGLNRANGTIRVGYMDGTSEVTWVYEKAVVRYSGNFQYSCLTQQLDENGDPANSFGILYESNKGSGVRTWFEAFTIEDITADQYTLEPEGTSILGDIDGNGEVSVTDALAILRMAVGLDTPIDLADMDGKDGVTVADALTALRIAVGLA